MRVVTILKKNELHNSDNYKDDLDVTVNDLTNVYARIIADYYKSVASEQYSQFIVLRGLDTVSNVFNHMIYYTRNLELALSYSEKAYMFYIEFVSQISDAEKLFLRLSSRDAIIYVFNKTIADIKYGNAKPTEETKQKYALFHKTANVLKTLAMKFDNEETFHKEVALIVEHGLTDQAIQMIDSVYYKTETNKLFHEIVLWILANQTLIHDIHEDIRYEENETFDEFKRKFGA